ncbi:hypothetical protein EV702DRAFT_1215374 [Suillus placidus]|uniref:Uncharacterized protein n=1 Tax=Suillus placidus TaxID=48579 RepID=A0A9P6ZG10_9AGAM|nr:hypothetical protein EV702DRAFT_1215374 [Suillus placidus]
MAIITQTDYPGSYSLLLQNDGAKLAAFEAHDDHLQKTYSTAHENNTDIDLLETNIHSLIQSLGFDLSTFDTDCGQPHLDDPYGVGLGQDSFDINSYLNGMDLVYDMAGHSMGQGEEDPDIESLRLVDKLDSLTAHGAVIDKKVPSEEVHAFLDGVASHEVHGIIYGDSTDLLSTKGMKTMSKQQVAQHMDVTIHRDVKRPHETIPGFTVSKLGGPKYELVKLIISILIENGQILDASGYLELGGFVLESLKEGAKADPSTSLGIILERVGCHPSLLLLRFPTVTHQAHL